jgi:hypothetical protein
MPLSSFAPLSGILQGLNQAQNYQYNQIALQNALLQQQIQAGLWPSLQQYPGAGLQQQTPPPIQPSQLTSPQTPYQPPYNAPIQAQPLAPPPTGAAGAPQQPLAGAGFDLTGAPFAGGQAGMPYGAGMPSNLAGLPLQPFAGGPGMPTSLQETLQMAGPFPGLANLNAPFPTQQGYEALAQLPFAGGGTPTGLPPAQGPAFAGGQAGMPSAFSGLTQQPTFGGGPGLGGPDTYAPDPLTGRPTQQASFQPGQQLQAPGPVGDPNTPQPPQPPPQQTGMLPDLVAGLESSGGTRTADQLPSMVDKVYGQYRDFIGDYGGGAAGVNNFAEAELRARPNATWADFYADYVLGTGQPGQYTAQDLATTNVPGARGAYRNLVNNSGVPPNTPLAALVGGQARGGPQQAHAETTGFINASTTPQEKAHADAGARNILAQMPNPLAFAGRIEIPQLVQAIDRGNPNASDAVKSGIFMKLYPMLSQVSQQEYTKLWEQYKEAQTERRFDITKEQQERDFQQRQRDLEAQREFNRQLATGKFQQGADRIVSTVQDPKSGKTFGYTASGEVREIPFPEHATKIPGAGAGAQTLPEIKVPDKWEGMPDTPPPGVREDIWDTTLGYARTGQMPPLGMQSSLRPQIIQAYPAALHALGIKPSEAPDIHAAFAGERHGQIVLGGRAAQIGLGLREAEKLAPTVAAAAKGIPATEFPAYNNLLNWLNTQSGDPKIVQFRDALNAFLQTYARTTGGTMQLTDFRLQHAYTLLNDAMSRGQIKGALDQLTYEMKVMGSAVPETSEDIREIGQPPATRRPTAAPPPPGGGDTGAPYSVGQIIERGGKRYRVTGGDPNDPDIEEVK